MRVLIAVLAFAGMALVAAAARGPGLPWWPGEVRHQAPAAAEAMAVAERD